MNRYELYIPDENKETADEICSRLFCQGARCRQGFPMREAARTSQQWWEYRIETSMDTKALIAFMLQVEWPKPNVTLYDNAQGKWYWGLRNMKFYLLAG